MEEDIKNYLPTVMFRGTPCNYLGGCEETQAQDPVTPCTSQPCQVS